MSNPVKLAPGMDVDGNAQREFDVATQETIVRMSAAVLDEDFLGAGHPASLAQTASTGYPWAAKIQGIAPPTVGLVANQPGGVIASTLTSAVQKQEATLYSLDQLNWDMTKYASFEARCALSVLPSTSEVQIVWGLHGGGVSGDGPNNSVTYLDFQVLGSGAVTVRVKDGVTGGGSNVQSFATGVTLVAGVFHNFRIDISNPANVVFYIDGVRVSPAPPNASMVFAGTGLAALMQPYLSAYKAGATAGVGTLQIDMVQVSMNRS